jgi:hypothetical protein
MFVKALILGALAALLGTTDATPKKKDPSKAKPGENTSSSAAKDQNPIIRPMGETYKIL